MDATELMAQIDEAPLSQRADLQRMALFATIGAELRPEFEPYARQATTYQGFFNAIFADPAQKSTLLWAECAKMCRRNWLGFFEPKLLIQNLRLKTDGLPIQMGTGVVLAPTGSRDNIANLYVFAHGAFNRAAAEFVTSVGGRFTLADYDFCGIYGIYQYRGNVILEEWDVQEQPVHNPSR